MILHVFVVFDRKTAQYGNPMFLVNEGQAVRSFSDEINRKADDNMLSRHSDDFDLYGLGSYDGETGLFSCAQPRLVITGGSVKT